MVSRRYRSLFGRRFWGLNFGRRTGPYKMASSVPCLHGAVELLLTGDQHKPCASFNQQARKNTTSVAEGKRETPQKIASKGAKIYKKKPPFWGPKMDPFWGLPILFFRYFCAFWCNFLRGFPFAFRYGCCILTCLLIETGAWLVLVARQ